MMTPDKILLGYVAVLLGAVALVAVLGEMRRRRFRPERSEDRIFKCQKCAFVYTDDPDVDRSRCPQCGQLNHAIEF
jgi:rubrerythrin